MIVLTICTNCERDDHRMCPHEVSKIPTQSIQTNIEGKSMIADMICVCESPLHLPINQR